MSKTMETLDEVKQALPNPELYVILNGQPTNTQVVWRSLVNVRLVKAAVHKLKQINWLYKDVDPDSVDDATKKVVEVINNTSSKMLEKATKEDIAGFKSYTIRPNCQPSLTLTNLNYLTSRKILWTTDKSI